MLTNYDTAKNVWDHLKHLYVTSNFTKQYQLEIDIRTLKQNNMTIQNFYSAMSNLWDHLVLTESDELRAFKSYIDRREEKCLVQFVMPLRDDFEGLHGTILHHTPLPTIDSIVNKLWVEEIRFNSHSHSYHERGNLFLYPSVLLLLLTKENHKEEVVLISVLFERKMGLGKHNVQNC